MDIEWKIIPDYTMYLVGSNGEIRSLQTGKLKTVKPIIVHGYHYVNLYKNKKHKRFAVHRLVASAFIPNPENKYAVDHIDCDKSNNDVSNLRWVTAKENSNNPITVKNMKTGLVGHYAGLGRTGNKHPLSKPIERIDINGNIVSYECINEAVRDGFTKEQIRKCCLGITNIYKKYIWRFKGDTSKDSIDLKKEISKHDWPVWRKDIDGKITYYEHVSLAVKDGFTRNHIYQCCKNANKPHKNNAVYWSFVPYNA